MRTIIALTAAIAASLTTWAPVQAGSLGRACTQAPAQTWLSIGELQKKVEAQGYRVRKGKIKNACGEIYTLDKDGNRVELFVDPTSGAIVGKL